MFYNVHNFRLKVPTWVLLLVVLVAVGIASMGDLTPYGASMLVNTIFTKALPAMLTVCAAVFYSPTSSDAKEIGSPTTTPYVPPTVVSGN